MPSTEETPTDAVPGAHWLELANETSDPLECLAMATTGLLEIQVHTADQAGYHSIAQVQADELAKARGVIDQILEVCAKSKGQLAEKVRAVVDEAYPVTDPGEPVAAAADSEGTPTE